MKTNIYSPETYFAPPNLETWLRAWMWVNRGLLCAYTRKLIRTHQRQLLAYGETIGKHCHWSVCLRWFWNISVKLHCRQLWIYIWAVEELAWSRRCRSRQNFGGMGQFGAAVSAPPFWWRRFDDGRFGNEMWNVFSFGMSPKCKRSHWRCEACRRKIRSSTCPNRTAM